MTDRQEVWIVDRIEGERAVVERALHETLTLPRALLPVAAREGDALRVTIATDDEDARLSIVRDPEETRRRAAEARRVLGELKKRNPGGRIEL